MQSFFMRTTKTHMSVRTFSQDVALIAIGLPANSNNTLSEALTVLGNFMFSYDKYRDDHKTESKYRSCIEKKARKTHLHKPSRVIITQRLSNVNLPE